jgi:hypothetical protein
MAATRHAPRPFRCRVACVEQALERRDVDRAGVPSVRRTASAADGPVVGFITVLPGVGSALELEDLFVAPIGCAKGSRASYEGPLGRAHCRCGIPAHHRLREDAVRRAATARPDCHQDL